MLQTINPRLITFAVRVSFVPVLVCALLLTLGTGVQVSTVLAAANTYKVPAMRLPWDRSLTNIPLTGGPHAGNSQHDCTSENVSQQSGVDFGLFYGTDVLAVAQGTVFLAGPNSGPEGPYVVGINHGNNFATEYWHLSWINPAISVGTFVTQGMLLGKSGQPKNGAPHLHLEFRTGPPNFYTPVSAHGMPIDGYMIWTYVNPSSGKGYNYEGTMTRGATMEVNSDNICSTYPNGWHSVNGPTIYARVDRTGGYLASTNSEVPINGKIGKFFYNPNDSGIFDVNPSTPPVFTQSFRNLYFNPPTNMQTFCSNNTGVDENTRPFTNVSSNPNGTCTTTIVQGNGHQAGVGDLSSFEAVFTPTLFVPRAGQVTFNVYADDGWILSIGPDSNGRQPTYVSGPLNNPPPFGPFTGFPVVGANNQTSPPTAFTDTISVPEAGNYPIEIDYTECCQGQLTLLMTAYLSS